MAAKAFQKTRNTFFGLTNKGNDMNYDLLTGASYDEVKTFVEDFKATYSGEEVPPICFTAYMIAGEDTSALNVNPYWTEAGK